MQSVLFDPSNNQAPDVMKGGCLCRRRAFLGLRTSFHSSHSTGDRYYVLVQVRPCAHFHSLFLNFSVCQCTRLERVGWSCCYCCIMPCTSPFLPVTNSRTTMARNPFKPRHLPHCLATTAVRPSSSPSPPAVCAPPPI